MAGRLVGKFIEDNTIQAVKLTDNAIEARHMSTTAKVAVKQSKILLWADQINSFTTSSSQSDTVTDEVFSVAGTKKTGGGSSALGLVTTTPYNKGGLQDSDTKDHIKDTNGNQVYARLTATDTSKTGTATFTKNSTTVTGSGTLFTTELAPGDYIKLDSNGTVGKVQSITDDTTLTLASNYEGESGTGAFSAVVLTLSYYVFSSGSEVAHSMSGETIDFQVIEAFDLDNVPASAPLSNIGFAEAVTAAHNHDDRYYTETELSDTGIVNVGAALIGVDSAAIAGANSVEVQGALEDIAHTHHNETKVITTQNVIPDLANPPKWPNEIDLYVGGLHQPKENYSVSGLTITWNAGVAGFNIDPGDQVEVSYDADATGGP